jgi:hypothetical protein
METSMLRAPSKFVRPEPFTPRTLIDAARYYELAELVRVLEGEIEAEAKLRSPGQRGLGRAVPDADTAVFTPRDA